MYLFENIDRVRQARVSAFGMSEAVITSTSSPISNASSPKFLDFDYPQIGFVRYSSNSLERDHSCVTQFLPATSKRLGSCWWSRVWTILEGTIKSTSSDMLLLQGVPHTILIKMTSLPTEIMRLKIYVGRSSCYWFSWTSCSKRFTYSQQRNPGASIHLDCHYLGGQGNCAFLIANWRCFCSLPHVRATKLFGSGNVRPLIRFSVSDEPVIILRHENFTIPLLICKFTQLYQHPDLDFVFHSTSPNLVLYSMRLRWVMRWHFFSFDKRIIPAHYYIHFHRLQSSCAPAFFSSRPMLSNIMLVLL